MRFRSSPAAARSAQAAPPEPVCNLSRRLEKFDHPTVTVVNLVRKKYGLALSTRCGE